MRSILVHRHGFKEILGIAVNWLIRPGMIPRSLLLLLLTAAGIGEATAQGRLYWTTNYDPAPGPSHGQAIFSGDLNGEGQKMLFTNDGVIYDLAVNPRAEDLCFALETDSSWGIGCLEDGVFSLLVEGSNSYDDDFWNPVFAPRENKLYFYCEGYCYEETLSRYAILGIDLITGEKQAMVPPGFGPNSNHFDIDPATNAVYYHYENWADDDVIRGIAKVNLDGSEFDLLVTSAPDPDDDPYFIDNLAIDPARGYVYWTGIKNHGEVDETATIERMRLDGTERETIFSSESVRLHRISIPYGGKYLYAVCVNKTYTSGFIGRLPLDGNGGFEEVTQTHANAIAVYLSTPTIFLEGGPRNGDEGVELTPALNWVEVDGAVSYNLQITEGTDFDAGKSSGLVVDTTGLQDSEFDVPAGTLQPGTSYSWRIQTVTPDGSQTWTTPFSFTTTSESVGIESEETTPAAIALLQNYPNPFNPRTRIPFRLEKGGFTTLSIYNVLGQKVATLVAEHLPAGLHEVTWESSGFPSGTYLCRLQAGQSNDSRVLNLIK